MDKRKDMVRRFAEDPQISVLVIGGGINGIGIFRELAMQGLDVLLIDRGDFCSGASAASSHMVHGGLRYLENGEFRLVREAVQERNRLLENAPHQVHPLPTVIPIFKLFSGILNAPLKFIGLFSRPSERGALMVKIGLMLYDAYTRAQATVPTHRFEGRSRSLSRFPQLNPGVKFTATYYDGAMPSPERICVELIADSRRANPAALAMNYTSLVGREDGVIRLRDELTGDLFSVQPELVINAAGPWIDPVNQLLGWSSSYIGGTKGSHLILDHPELRQAMGENEIFFENKDGRIVLLFPLEDKVLIGSSDIRVDDPDHVSCSEEEVAYFFQMVQLVFPHINLQRKHIIFQFSGVRPLPYTPEGSTGLISRDHQIKIDEVGGMPVYSLIGGKWTTFRAFSEQVADKVLAYLQHPRITSTRSMAIGGGRDYSRDEVGQAGFIADLVDTYHLLEDQAWELFKRYGNLAAEVAEYIGLGEDEMLPAVPGFSRREIEFITKHEDVQHLDDLLLRRTNLAKLGLLSKTGLVSLAGVVGEVKGWDKDVQQEEIDRCRRLLQEHHGVELV